MVPFSSFNVHLIVRQKFPSVPSHGADGTQYEIHLRIRRKVRQVKTDETRSKDFITGMLLFTPQMSSIQPIIFNQNGFISIRL